MFHIGAIIGNYSRGSWISSIYKNVRILLKSFTAVWQMAWQDGKAMPNWIGQGWQCGNRGGKWQEFLGLY